MHPACIGVVVFQRFAASQFNGEQRALAGSLITIRLMAPSGRTHSSTTISHSNRTKAVSSLLVSNLPVSRLSSLEQVEVAGFRLAELLTSLHVSGQFLPACPACISITIISIIIITRGARGSTGFCVDVKPCAHGRIGRVAPPHDAFSRPIYSCAGRGRAI